MTIREHGEFPDEVPELPKQPDFLAETPPLAPPSLTRNAGLISETPPAVSPPKPVAIGRVMLERAGDEVTRASAHSPSEEQGNASGVPQVSNTPAEAAPESATGTGGKEPPQEPPAPPREVGGGQEPSRHFDVERFADEQGTPPEVYEARGKVISAAVAKLAAHPFLTFPYNREATQIDYASFTYPTATGEVNMLVESTGTVQIVIADTIGDTGKRVLAKHSYEPGDLEIVRHDTLMTPDYPVAGEVSQEKLAQHRLEAERRELEAREFGEQIGIHGHVVGPQEAAYIAGIIQEAQPAAMKYQSYERVMSARADAQFALDNPAARVNQGLTADEVSRRLPSHGDALRWAPLFTEKMHQYITPNDQAEPVANPHMGPFVDKNVSKTEGTPGDELVCSVREDSTLGATASITRTSPLNASEQQDFKRMGIPQDALTTLVTVTQEVFYVNQQGALTVNQSIAIAALSDNGPVQLERTPTVSFPAGREEVYRLCYLLASDRAL